MKFLIKKLGTIFQIEEGIFDEIDQSLGMVPSRKDDPWFVKYRAVSPKEVQFFQKYDYFIDKSMKNFDTLLKEDSVVDSEYLTMLTFEFIENELAAKFTSNLPSLQSSPLNFPFDKTALFFFRDLCYLNEMIFPLLSSFLSASEQGYVMGSRLHSYDKNLIEQFVATALKFAFKYKGLMSQCKSQLGLHKKFVQILYIQNKKGEMELDFDEKFLQVSRDSFWYQWATEQKYLGSEFRQQILLRDWSMVEFGFEYLVNLKELTRLFSNTPKVAFSPYFFNFVVTKWKELVISTIRENSGLVANYNTAIYELYILIRILESKQKPLIEYPSEKPEERILGMILFLLTNDEKSWEVTNEEGYMQYIDISFILEKRAILCYLIRK